MGGDDVSFEVVKGERPVAQEQRGEHRVVGSDGAVASEVDQAAPLSPAVTLVTVLAGGTRTWARRWILRERADLVDRAGEIRSGDECGPAVVPLEAMRDRAHIAADGAIVTGASWRAVHMVRCRSPTGTTRSRAGPSGRGGPTSGRECVQAWRRR